jgi:HD-like signal output (HDOD) protein
MNTRKRLLFVVDEPMILDALRRMLRPMRTEWDMTFAGNGATALEMMAQQSFDVVVSDMRMPGMNGAEFLNEVMNRYPKTIRLILSGHADKDMYLQCVRSAHQFLSKPCDAESLKAILLRAFSLDACLKNEIIQRVVSQMDHLPSVPDVYSEMVEKLHDADPRVEDIGAIIAKDMGMTAKILKLVNSAYFGLQREVTGPTDAVSYLGIDTIKSLVLALQVFSQFDGVQLPGFFLESLWTHSLDTAAAARAVGAAEGGEHKLRDECFVSGILHDAGKLVLALNFSEKYTEAIRRSRSQGEPLWVAEQQVFGVNHADVGGYLLGLWGLPVPVVEAIALHHTPSQSPARALSALLAVHVANALVARPRSGGAPASVDRLLDLPYLGQAGLAGRVEAWRTALPQNLAKVA